MKTIREHLETLPEPAPTRFSPLFLSACEADVHTRFDMARYWRDKKPQDLSFQMDADIHVQYTAELCPSNTDDTVNYFKISGIIVECYAESTVEAV